MPALTTKLHDFALDVPGLCRIDIGLLFITVGVPAQRVHVSLNGETVGEVRLTQNCALEFIADAPGLVSLYCPDGRRPCDFGVNIDERTLSIGIASVSVHPTQESFAGLRVMRREMDLAIEATGLSSHDLAMRFESLGVMCELGLVQRQMGAEPLGLLRFSNTPLETLLRMLDGRFKGLGARDSLVVRKQSAQQEFIGEDSRYGLEYHTWQYATQTTAEAVLERDVRRLPFLARKLVQTLEDTDKIMVFKTASLSDKDAWRLLEAVQAYGSNRLLVVQGAGPGDVAGQVVDLGNGLMRGWITCDSAEWWALATAWAPVLSSAYRMAYLPKTAR